MEKSLHNELLSVFAMTEGKFVDFAKFQEALFLVILNPLLSVCFRLFPSGHIESSFVPNSPFDVERGFLV